MRENQTPNVSASVNPVGARRTKASLVGLVYHILRVAFVKVRRLC